MSPNRTQRHAIARDTIARSESITAEYLQQGASLESTFIAKQFPALDPAACPYPNALPTSVDIVNSDSFALARKIMKEDPDAVGKTTVLNLASDIRIAGGWLHFMSMTQEEALCFSSTLFKTLREEYYPWKNLGPGSAAGVWSPGVVIFKDDLDHECVDLAPEDRRVVSIITVAAPCAPPLTSDGKSFRDPTVVDDLREKIKLVYRMAAHNGQQYMVLGAMGCGAYECPPRLVAEEMKSVLLDAEFKGWFKKVVFAVYSVKNNGPGNFEVFEDVFKGVKYNA